MESRIAQGYVKSHLDTMPTAREYRKVLKIKAFSRFQYSVESLLLYFMLRYCGSSNYNRLNPLRGQKQLGTLQNLMIKPYSILQIISVKTLIWFMINSVKALICIGIASLFIKLTFRFEYFYIVILVCFGCMGISYILSAFTLIFTKMASFVSIVGYLFLFLSGSILSLPECLQYTNPLSAGSHFYVLLIHQTAGVKDYFMLLILCAAYFFVGKEIFAFVFRRSKQFKWTY